ncbi:flagellar biosynthetic protein FliO [Exilibacterium tricleocarpae]|uniref:Flagellar protein n=1 Tax=Exilibacterium tricleocarpae TaxID=2591008 RepID=A0A545U449_9GAMM|nr:flagellar biosynthetic protein FliO [Exilibacterium tricleocarpae]TQV84183.1 flagellar biosynthetic protein FliO [Exilibacterium tricleocarpae]
MLKKPVSPGTLYPGFFAGLVFAAPGGWAQAPAAATAGAPDNAAYIGQVMLGLLAILAIIFAIAWLVRRLGAGGLLQSDSMRVVGSLPLSTRERLLLVEVAGRQLLIGVAPGHVSTLYVFDEPVVAIKPDRELSAFGRKVRDVMQQGRTS